MAIHAYLIGRVVTYRIAEEEKRSNIYIEQIPNPNKILNFEQNYTYAHCACYSLSK